MNIGPKSTFEGNNSDGTTFTMREWDFSTLAQIEITSFLVMMAVSFLISSVASPILLIVSLLTFNGRVKLANIVGFLISLYFLVDCTHNWIGISSVNLFVEKEGIRFLIKINITAMIMHFLLIAFNSSIYKFVVDKTDKFMFFLIVSAMLLFFLHNVFAPNFVNKIAAKRFKTIDRIDATVEQYNRHKVENMSEIEKEHETDPYYTSGQANRDANGVTEYEGE